jgi:hypothetical protein
MSTGPEFPQPQYEPPPIRDDAAAAKQTTAPAICMIVVNLLNVATNAVSWCALPFAQRFYDKLAKETPDLKDAAELLHQPWLVWLLAATTLISLVALVGSVQMMRRRGHAFAVVSAVLTMLPIGGCCCLFNLAAGIWAMVVLMKDEVRSAFQ